MAELITFAAGRPGTGECANRRHPETRCRYDFLVVRRGPLAYQKYLHTYSQDFRSTFGYVVVGILVRLMCHFLVWCGGDSFPAFPCQILDEPPLVVIPEVASPSDDVISPPLIHSSISQHVHFDAAHSITWCASVTPRPAFTNLPTFADTLTNRNSATIKRVIIPERGENQAATGRSASVT